MNTIRLTLNPSLEEVLEKLEMTYKPMSRSEILKMTIAEFYNSRFGNGAAKKATQSPVKAQERVELINQWIKTKQQPDLPAEELEDAFGEWWAENKKELRK